MASLDPKGACGRSHETAPVHRPSPPSKDVRYRKPDALVTGSTHTDHRSARSPRRTPEEPARDNPILGPRTGMTRSQPSNPASAGASVRHKAPGSRPASTCPAQPPSKSEGASPRDGRGHHSVGKADRSNESDRTCRGALHQRGAARHAREARRRPQPRHTDRCQATTTTGCRKPGQRAQHATSHGTGTGARQQPTHTPQTPARSGGVQAEHAHKHTHPNIPARSGGAQPKPEPKHTHPQRTPQPGVPGYRRGAHTNAHRPQQPSQEWRGEAETRAQAHTPTPHTPARSGGVQAERAQENTHSPTTQLGEAGFSRDPSPSTHTQTAHPSQRWRSTSGARTRTHTHTPQHPSREWRGAAETRAQA